MAIVLASVVAVSCDDSFEDSVPPGAVLDLSVAAMGDSGVVLRWTAPGDDESAGRAASYDLRHASWVLSEDSFDTATVIPVAESPGPAGAPDSAVVDGLPRGQRYYFALRTSDDAGNSSDLSNIDSLDVPEVPDRIAPAPVSDLHVWGVEVNQVMLTWTASGDDGSQGRATAYDLRFATVALDESNWTAASEVAGLPVPASAGHEETLTVPGLDSGTSYWFALKVQDDAGNWSALSNVSEQQTPRVPRAWRVRADGSGDVPTIQAAIDVAVDGDSVLIGMGVYDGLLRIDGKALTLIGEGGAEQVSLTESVSTAPSTLTVTLDAGKRVEIEGLRFHKGRSDRSPGGALSMYGPGDLAVKRCRFEENQSMSFVSTPWDPWAGALYVQSARELLIEDCLFVANRGVPSLIRHSDPVGGAVMATCETARVIRCVFRNNVVRGTECGGTGGALCFRGTSLQLEDCEFSDNVAGGGGAIASTGSMTMVRCRFTGNHGSASSGPCFGGVGSIVRSDGQAHIDQCVFVDNEVSGNVVLLVGSGGITMRDCTVAFNTVSGGGGYPIPLSSVRIEPPVGTPVEFVRNLVASNTSYGFRHNLVDLSGVSCNNIWGNGARGISYDFGAGTDFRGMNGNIGLDPRFCRPSLKMTEVAADSPCLPGNPGHPDGCGVIGSVAAGCDTPLVSRSGQAWR